MPDAILRKRTIVVRQRLHLQGKAFSFVWLFWLLMPVHFWVVEWLDVGYVNSLVVSVAAS